MAEGEVVELLHHRGIRRAEQALRQQPPDRHRRKRAAAARRARAQEAPQPAAGGHAAVLHEILRVEMRARFVLGSGAVDDRQIALVVGGREVGEQRMQAEEAVERHASSLASPRRGRAW